MSDVEQVGSENKDNYNYESSTTVSPTYNGFDQSVHENIQQLSRQLTETNEAVATAISTKPQQTDDKSSLQSTTSSLSSAPGVVMINNPEIDPRLDPTNDDFSSKYWIQNFKKLMDKDPDYYKQYSLGITYKNLRAYGQAADADYQATVLNAPLRIIDQYVRPYLRTKRVKREAQFDILKPMDAVVKPGEMVVVLGRPGSGCSTLLKTISANTHGFHIDPSSQISYDGFTMAEIRKNYRGEVIYSAESDIHFPKLTVWQTLSLAAKFRTPKNRIPGISREDYANHITEVYMATYGLSHVKDTRVGDQNIRGVSGGERKRVSIAEVSLSGAKLQCWDNATRGLDAATALEFVKALKTSTDILNICAFIAIYQCSQDAYDLFDKVSLLYEGRQIFFGRIDKAKDFFVKMGYFCPKRQTTADFLTSLTSPSERRAQWGLEDKVPKTPADFEAYWKASLEYQELVKEVDESLAKNSQLTDRNYIEDAQRAKHCRHMPKTSSYMVSWPLQVRYLVKREFQRLWNDMGSNAFMVGGNSFISLILSSVFYNLQNTTGSFYYRGAAMFFSLLFNAFSSFLEIMLLFEARPIIEKHKQYALYHPAAASLASIISQVPSKVITSIAFNLIFYFMVNFRRNPGRFFFYYLMNVTSTFFMSHIFRFIGSCCGSLEVALLPGCIILLGMTIFTGFVIPINYMLGWSRWINYIDPLGYAFEALMTNEFSGRVFDCSSFIPADPRKMTLLPDGYICSAVSSVVGEVTVNGTRYMNVTYSYYAKHKWRNWGIGLAFVIFFLLAHLLVAEFNESAKQKGEVLLFQSKTLRKLKKEHGSIKNDLEAGSEQQITQQDDGLSQSVSKGLSSGTDIFHWRDVCFSVDVKGGKRLILDKVDGWVKPGTLTALMGASGAGKTTLLDVLASRVTFGVISGNIFVNGHLRDESFQRSIGYAQQMDIHLRTSTVREALIFSALLRQPREVPDKEKYEYVEEIINLLEMEKYADAVVGVPGSGLNVEQRKRLTIGVEMAAKPKLLLFLDEPTSGLDSQTSWAICKLMRKLSNSGQAILCTIHQPSAMLMQEFDRLLFLQSGGRTVYFGDLGKHCATLIDYFERNGASKCPPEANPAEWMLSVIGAAPGSHTDKDYHEIWMSSPEHQSILKELDNMEKELLKKPYDNSLGKHEFAAPLWKQYKLVCHRVFEQYWRDPSYIWSKMAVALFTNIFIGFSFFNAKVTQQGLQNQMYAVFMFLVIFLPMIQQMLPNYVEQRNLYEARERPSKTFSWIAFILSQISVEIPWNALVGTLSFFCFYYPVGFYHNASPHGSAEVHKRGAYAWFAILLYFVYTGTFGHMTIAPLELANSAGNASMLMFTLCMTFCGVLAGPKVLPGFWIFMYRISPITYFIDGFLSNAVARNSIVCSEEEFVRLSPPQGMTCGQYLETYIKAAGTGYLVDENATDTCEFCSVSTTDAYLEQVSCRYHRRWRNIGFFIAFICFNIGAATFLYWLVRVPKKKNRMREKHEETGKVKSSNDSGDSSAGVQDEKLHTDSNNSSLGNNLANANEDGTKNE